MKEYKSFADLQSAWNDVCEEAERCISQEEARDKISEFLLGLNQGDPGDILGKSYDCETHRRGERPAQSLPRE